MKHLVMSVTATLLVIGSMAMASNSIFISAETVRLVLVK